MIWGMFSIIAFNLTDAYFVGKLGTAHLAALSFTFPVVMTFGSLAVGLGVGTCSVLSRAIGEGDHRKVQTLATDSLTLSLLFVGVFILIGVFTIDPLFGALGADAETLPLVRQYMRIWYLGMMFLVVPMVGNNAIRASGDTINPSLIMTVSAVINIVLDPILIFGWGPIPRLEIQGAAIATVFARAISMAASLAILHYRKKMLVFRVPAVRSVLDSWRQILRVGLPAAGTYAIGPVAIGLVTAMLASFGAAAVAAFGVASRIEGFALIAMFGLSTSVAPFVGQNYGAALHHRVRRGLDLAFLFSVVWGVALAVVLAAVRTPLVGLFDTNPEVIRIASLYLLIVPVSFGAQGIMLITSSSFNALGRPLPSAALTLVRMFVLYVPLALVGKLVLGPVGIFAAASIANFIAAFWSIKWIARVCVANGAQASGCRGPVPESSQSPG
ncbi:MAG: MATE family efflux transporter [Phycisphaerae bacterium]|nr:MATE family efflux transporter [Phycisphaerae bacterium]